MAEATKKAVRREVGVTGLDFTMGFIQADPDVKLQGTTGIAQYDLMRHTDATVAAILMALSLPVREAQWQVSPASSAGADVEAAEFVESCMYDMSFSWDDFLTEVCTMYTFGWAWMEWVLKGRNGPNPRGNEAPSIYDDGRIGFRKIALRGQTSLDRWDMDDDTGKLKGMIQWVKAKRITVPLEKSILFRTTKELNNPEGFSVLRPAHRAWTYKRNIERIEAIGIQRALQGFPIFKLLAGATRTGQTDAGTSTEERAQQAIQRMYDNTMLGLIEDEDMEMRFESPDMRGMSQDSTVIIQRYDEAIARAALAMYILLGTRERGSYALATELGDLFFLAVEGFISMIGQTFSKYAVPILFRHNAFPGITGYPEITTAINRRVDLQALGEFINASVGSQVIVPDGDLEKHVRELADFPPATVNLDDRREIPTPESGDLEEQAGPPAEEGQKEQSERSSRSGFETFARTGVSAYNKATDEYQAGLRGSYLDWVAAVEKELKDTDPSTSEEEMKEKWAALVALGLSQMQHMGWEALPQAFELGYGGSGFSPEARSRLEEEIAENDRYLRDNLWQKIGRALTIAALMEIARLYWSGRAKDGSALLHGALVGIAGNVGQYSGAYWRAIWAGAIAWDTDYREHLLTLAPLEELSLEPARWELDALAKHCNTCLVFGARDYASLDDLLAVTGGTLPGQGTECDGNCRCTLWVLRGGVWVILHGRGW